MTGSLEAAAEIAVERVGSSSADTADCNVEGQGTTTEAAAGGDNWSAGGDNPPAGASG